MANQTNQVEYVNAKQVGELLGKSNAYAHLMTSQGLLPQPETLPRAKGAMGPSTVKHWRFDDVVALRELMQGGSAALRRESVKRETAPSLEWRIGATDQRVGNLTKQFGKEHDRVSGMRKDIAAMRRNSSELHERLAGLQAEAAASSELSIKAARLAQVALVMAAVTPVALIVSAWVL